MSCVLQLLSLHMCVVCSLSFNIRYWPPCELNFYLGLCSRIPNTIITLKNMCFLRCLCQNQFYQHIVFLLCSQTKLTNGSSLASNSNNSNRNKMNGLSFTISSGGEGKASPRDIEIKVQTLKRKQKELKAELHNSLCKTTSYQVAFQEEVDMRTKIEEKHENLRKRFDVSSMLMACSVWYESLPCAF